MKKVISLVALLLLAGTASIINAQDVEKVEKVRKWFIEAGLSVYAPKETYIGGILSGGYYFSEKNRISIDIGANFCSKKISNFMYVVTQNGRSETFHDGVINRQYTFSPVLLSWGHEFRLSNKLKLRTGPSIGINYLSAKNDYSAESHDISKAENKPDEYSASKSLFTGGAIVALEWRLFKPSGLGFSYRILVNESMDFELIKLNPVAHQINITYWWKF
jgi:hypothetical protein